MNYFLATATTFPEPYFGYGRSIGLGVPCLTANSEPLVTVSCHTAPRIPSGGGSGMRAPSPSPGRDDAHAATQLPLGYSSSSCLPARTMWNNACDPPSPIINVMSTGGKSSGRKEHLRRGVVEFYFLVALALSAG